MTVRVSAFFLKPEICHFGGRTLSPHFDTDLFVNFSLEGPLHCQVGFDFIFATVVKRLTFGQTNERWTYAFCSLLPPVLGARLPCFVYFIRCELGDRRVVL